MNCSNTVTSNPNPVVWTQTTTARLFTTNISWMLLAFIITQTYTFYRTPRKGEKFTKIIVYFLVIIQFLDTGVASYIAYFLLASNWGNFSLETAGATSLLQLTLDNLLLFLGGLSGFAVQVFFIWRIWRFSITFLRGSIKVVARIVCAFVILMSVSSFAFSISAYAVVLVGATRTPLIRTSNIGALFDIMIVVWIITSMAADLTITLWMSLLLFRARTHALSGQLLDKLSNLLQITVQTGFLTTVLAIAAIALYPSKSPYQDFSVFTIGKVYSIWLLSNLNANGGSEHRDAEAPRIETLRFAKVEPKSVQLNSSSFMRSLGTMSSAQSDLSTPATMP